MVYLDQSGQPTSRENAFLEALGIIHFDKARTRVINKMKENGVSAAEKQKSIGNAPKGDHPQQQ